MKYVYLPFVISILTACGGGGGGGDGNDSSSITPQNITTTQSYGSTLTNGVISFNVTNSTFWQTDDSVAAGSFPEGCIYYAQLTWYQSMALCFQSNRSAVANLINPGKWILDGVEAPNINFEIGKTYRFNMDDPSNLGHTIDFSSLSGGPNGLKMVDGEWVSNFPNWGVATDEPVVISDEVNHGNLVQRWDSTNERYFEITITSNTPLPLYYYCRNHSGEGNVLTSASSLYDKSHQILHPLDLILVDH